MMIQPEIILNACKKPMSWIPKPINPTIKPRVLYIKIRPKLYSITPIKASNFEFLFNGIANAMGPHIPMQCKLETIPRIKADMNRVNTI